MPYHEYECEWCKLKEDVLYFHSEPVKKEIECPKCARPMPKKLSGLGYYEIKGNNSASVTPKKFRRQGR